MNATVLLIDEAQLECKINEWTLTHAGYNVVVATTADEGLRLAQDKPPDIIVLDSLAADAKGRQILSALKDNPLTTRIPVLVLFRKGQLATERFKSAGAAEIMDKEQAAEDGGLLLNTVEGLLHPVV